MIQQLLPKINLFSFFSENTCIELSYLQGSFGAVIKSVISATIRAKHTYRFICSPQIVHSAL